MAPPAPTGFHEPARLDAFLNAMRRGAVASADMRAPHSPFRSPLSARRFFGVPNEETIGPLLSVSADNQHEATGQSGYQVRGAVELPTQAVDLADHDLGRALLKCIGEPKFCEEAVTVMMRLVFRSSRAHFLPRTTSANSRSGAGMRRCALQRRLRAMTRRCTA